MKTHARKREESFDGNSKNVAPMCMCKDESNHFVRFNNLCQGGREACIWFLATDLVSCPIWTTRETPS